MDRISNDFKPALYQWFKAPANLLLDIDPAEAQRRKKKDIPDRLEKEGIEFQSRVREGYLKIAREEQERIKLLDAGKDFNEVLQESIKYIENIWPTKGRP